MEIDLREWTFDEDDELKNALRVISLVSDPATEDEFMLFSDTSKIMKFETTDVDKRIITGAAMIPNLPIERIDSETNEKYFGFFSEDTVERAAQLFFEKGDINGSNLQHIADIDGITFWESWIVTDPESDKSKAMGFKNVTKGSWFVSAKITNDMVWKNYLKSGMIRGFSVEIGIDEKKSDMVFSKISNILDSKLKDEDKYRLINKLLK